MFNHRPRRWHNASPTPAQCLMLIGLYYVAANTGYTTPCHVTPGVEPVLA